MSEEASDLLHRALRAEPGAFDEVVRAHHRAVFRLCERMLGNRDDAQEAAQEAFLAAYQGIGQFAGRAKLGTWLLAIAYRKAADRLRKGRNTPESLDDQGEEGVWRQQVPVRDFTDWSASPEDQFQRAEVRAAVAGALEGVPPGARAVFELKDIQGLSFEETAEVLGITEGAARVRLHRVRQYLMVELEQRLGTRRTRK